MTTRPVAVVTGSSRGIGQAVGEQLLADGWDVVALSRTPHPDPRVMSVPCDLSDPHSTRAALAAVDARTQRVDALVANAALRSLGRLADLPGAAWDEAVAVNLSSVVVLVQALLPGLRRQRGTVVVMGSHAGSRFFEGGAAYCATKAALKALVEVLLLEERPHGVRTTLLSPGAVANEHSDTASTKLSTVSVARAVSWILAAPDDLVVGELEIRPARLGPAPVSGFDRLQAV